MAAVRYLQKDQDRKVNGQFSFVSHDQVVGAIRPHMVEQGICFVPRVMEYRQDGNKTWVSMEFDFVNIDDPVDRLTVPMFAAGVDPQEKGTLKAISYCKKTCLLNVFMIETGNEADPERYVSPEFDHKPDLASDDDIEAIRELIGQTKTKEPAFCKFLDVKALELLQKKDVDRAIKLLQKKLKDMP